MVRESLRALSLSLVQVHGRWGHGQPGLSEGWGAPTRAVPVQSGAGPADHSGNPPRSGSDSGDSLDGAPGRSVAV